MGSATPYHCIVSFLRSDVLDDEVEVDESDIFSEEDLPILEEEIVPQIQETRCRSTRQQSASPVRKRAASTPSPTRQRTSPKDWPASLRSYDKEKDVKNRSTLSSGASPQPRAEVKKRSRSQSYEKSWRGRSPASRLSG